MALEGSGLGGGSGGEAGERLVATSPRAHRPRVAEVSKRTGRLQIVEQQHHRQRQRALGVLETWILGRLRVDLAPLAG